MTLREDAAAARKPSAKPCFIILSVKEETDNEKILVLALALLLPLSSAFAEHIRSDGMGGFYTDRGHVRSDGMGGYYR